MSDIFAFCMLYSFSTKYIPNINILLVQFIVDNTIFEMISTLTINICNENYSLHMLNKVRCAELSKLSGIPKLVGIFGPHQDIKISPLRSAYNLVRIPKRDEWKTASSAISEHSEYLVMPYGLVSTPVSVSNVNDGL